MTDATGASRCPLKPFDERGRDNGRDQLTGEATTGYAEGAMKKRSTSGYLLVVLGGVVALAAVSGSCGSDEGASGDGAGGAGATTSSGSSVDCGCSCEEAPTDVFFCGCPDQMNMDCCADDGEPTCSGGLDAVCVGPYETNHGWYCPCDGLTLPTCPPSSPPSCEPGAKYNDPSDDTWSCAGCDPNDLPSCQDECPICLNDQWACAAPGPDCPGAGGAGGDGATGGSGGAASGGAGGS